MRSTYIGKLTATFHSCIKSVPDALDRRSKKCLHGSPTLYLSVYKGLGAELFEEATLEFEACHGQYLAEDAIYVFPFAPKTAPQNPQTMVKLVQH